MFIFMCNIKGSTIKTGYYSGLPPNRTIEDQWTVAVKQQRNAQVCVTVVGEVSIQQVENAQG